ncbi:hypothetical protein T484DRAFT_1835393 [Baffinella frigidus]|nr:hypothetical protein T484DRAFT_1835393 [Cryptophyta sp. CCMP2293]
MGVGLVGIVIEATSAVTPSYRVAPSYRVIKRRLAMPTDEFCRRAGVAGYGLHAEYEHVWGHLRIGGSEVVVVGLQREADATLDTTVLKTDATGDTTLDTTRATSLKTTGNAGGDFPEDVRGGAKGDVRGDAAGDVITGDVPSGVGGREEGKREAKGRSSGEGGGAEGDDAKLWDGKNWFPFEDPAPLSDPDDDGPASGREDGPTSGREDGPTSGREDQPASGREDGPASGQEDGPASEIHDGPASDPAGEYVSMQYAALASAGGRDTGPDPIDGLNAGRDPIEGLHAGRRLDATDGRDGRDDARPIDGRGRDEARAMLRGRKVEVSASDFIWKHL